MDSLVAVTVTVIDVTEYLLEMPVLPSDDDWKSSGRQKQLLVEIDSSLRRQGSVMRVWMTGQTVMTTKAGAAPSPERLIVKAGQKLTELRSLDQGEKK